MPEVLVGIGSNADPTRALRGAVAALEQRFGGVRSSSVYESPALDARGADYLNMVVAFFAALPVVELTAVLRSIEAAGGRRREDRAVCALDLDLLFYGARVDAEARLPRAGAFETPFVLGPLAELTPELVHPVTGERAAAAWRRARHGSLVCLGALDELRDA
jgi:2-amino-4-hydroxy-6-hydroxymethyldihydropteridine diphosphokinase